MRILITMFFACISNLIYAQQTLEINFVSHESREKLPVTVTIKEMKEEMSADSSGMLTIHFPANETYTLLISSVGHEEIIKKISIPQTENSLTIELESLEHEEEEVIVQSTRTSRTIENVPTRVETIGFEEIDEKNNMRPANVAMLLHESTGIQVQQTSATSGNASIRIQGLDGRYTQLLKDGFPNYGNFSGGLSVLEIPPLDLKQVEIIKGPASPLFGGGAIAGVINFISKTPGEKPEYNFILNQSNIGQTNIGGFASARGKKTGYTMLALFNRQKAYDADKDDFTEVPLSKEFTIHPKLFIYAGDKTTINLGNSFTKGERTGGDIKVIKGNADASHRYFEKNESVRNITTAEVDSRISDNKRLLVRQSLSIFNRKIQIPSYEFSGKDLTAYTDISYITSVKKHALVTGLNYTMNDFDQDGSGMLNNKMQTFGAYAQHTLDASEFIKLETGLRVDAVKYKGILISESEVFLLPRISVLMKLNEFLTSRIGGGIGYKTPALFTEETETIQYRSLQPLTNVQSEKSYGGTADINFSKKVATDLSLSVNHMFFYTAIKKPLILKGDLINGYSFYNAEKPVSSAGFENNVKFIYKKYFKLFLGYTYTDSRAKYLTGDRHLPLVPKHKLNSALIYEKEGVLKLGLEGYFTGRQHLSNGSQTPSYKELGFMAEKIFNKFSVFINFENFTDTRQGRYKNVVNGSHLDPDFDEIWTHTEGFVINGGLKLKF